MSLKFITQAFKEASEDEKAEFISEMLPYILSNPIFNELEIPPRIRNLEKATGVYQFEEWEEHEPTISEKIQELEGKVSGSLTQVQEKQRSTLDQKAEEVAEHLKYCVSERTGGIYMNSKEFNQFMISVDMPEHLRMGAVRNPRQAKSDVFNRVVQRYPGFHLRRAKRNNEIVLVYRPIPSVCTEQLHTYISQSLAGCS